MKTQMPKKRMTIGFCFEMNTGKMQIDGKMHKTSYRLQSSVFSLQSAVYSP